jgi:hypothetical protein
MKKLILFLLFAVSLFADDLSNFGIFIYENPANEKAVFEVIAPEASNISVLVYDNLGNVLFSQKGSSQIVGNTNSLKINWNLLNRAGKRAAAGTYIIQATAKTANGNGIYQYFAQLGVKK